MPQKESLRTKLSPSNTAKSNVTAETPVQYLKGVGPRIGALFNARGINTVKDLLFFFPRSYEDRTKVSTVENLEEGLKSTFSIEVLSSRKIPTRIRGKSIFEVNAVDSSVMT
jgi:ATP-dependent DNA helicase RecG